LAAFLWMAPDRSPGKDE